MNLDELATNVARDIGAVRQRSCKRADGVEYHFEQSELEQFAKELITEYEKTVNSELYPRPDPRVAELEAKLQQMNSLCEFNERTMSDIASKYEALEAQNAALLAENEKWKVANEQVSKDCFNLTQKVIPNITNERDEYKPDAERYHGLKIEDFRVRQFVSSSYGWKDIESEDLDATIDAALAASKEPHSDTL